MAKIGGNIIMRIVDFCMLLLTLGMAMVLIASYFSPVVNPNKVWYFAFFGLFFPVFYISTIIFTLYWALRWSRIFFITFILLLIGIGRVSEFYKLPTGKKHHSATNKDETIKIITFNVSGFRDEDWVKYQTNEILGFIKDQDPDIISMQEFTSSKEFPVPTIDSILSDWKYIARNIKRSGWIQTVTYSKFPVLSQEEIVFENKVNTVIHCDLLVGTDTIRVINNHLQTTHVDKDNVKFLDDFNFTFDNEAKENIKRIAKKLKTSFSVRAHQTDSVSNLIHKKDIPTIVCGDFNDTPMSYVYKTIKGNYEDAFVNKGSGFGYTFKHLYRVLRIDFVLHSKDFQTVSYESPDVEWSDHNPVIVEIKLKKND